VILVTTYPLFTRNQHWTQSGEVDDRVPFVSMASEGTYNALRSLLAAAAEGYTTADDVLLDYNDPFQPAARPPVWLTVTTPNGYWPLALVSDQDFSRRAKNSPDPSELLLKWPEQSADGEPNDPPLASISTAHS